MGRGTYKYICEDCDDATWLTYGDRASRFKQRCQHCGSPYLVPSKKSYGPEAIKDASNAAYQQKAIIDKKMNKT